MGVLQNSFKSDQLRYPRVRDAYNEKLIYVKGLLEDNSIEIANLEIYIRAFKKEKVIELWGKNKNNPSFILIISFEVCQTSGTLGPKRKQGDLQIPEGFYHIDRFNPASNFHLSLGLNYPNYSDRILGERGNLGGDIFIHGDCVTIGCLPITDNKIKELYIMAVEAKNNGQEKIPVTIFPSIPSGLDFMDLLSKNAMPDEVKVLWNDLQKAYDLFQENKTLPEVEFLSDGSHEVK